MRFCVLAFAIVALVGRLARAQTQVENPVNLTAAAYQCNKIAAGNADAIVDRVSGNFFATMRTQEAIQDQATFNSGVYSIDSSISQNRIIAPGAYTANVPGFTTFKICVSSYSGDTAVVRWKNRLAINSAMIGRGGMITGLIAETAQSGDGSTGGARNSATNLTTTLTQCQPVGGTRSSTASSSPVACYADQFSGTTDAEKIVACFSALKTLNAAGGTCDARGLSGLTWDKDPYTAAGSNIPGSGTLLLPGGTITAKYGPVVAAYGWKTQGTNNLANGTGIGTTLSASSTWPNGGTGTYSNGTCTMGTPGTNETITCKGTNFTDNVATAGSGTIAKGCYFLSPSTQPPAANSTHGIITAINSATSITLGYGVNVGRGAPSNSNFTISCAAFEGGGNGSVSGQAQYASPLIDVALDCNSVIGCVPYQNWFGQQGVYAQGVTLRHYCGIGFDLEGSFFYDSGPYERVLSSPGSCASASAIPFVIRPFGGTFFGLNSIGSYSGQASADPTVGVDVSGYGFVKIDGVDSEGPMNGVVVGASTACPVSTPCVQPPYGAAQGNLSVDITNVHQETPRSTSAVTLSNANAFIPSSNLRNINGSAAKYVLLDQNNSCTIATATEGRLANYSLNANGNIAVSSSLVARCFPAPPVTYQFFCTGKATADSTLYPFPFNSSGATTCTATSALPSAFPAPANCTLRNLIVNAGTAGVSGDEVTVINNGTITSIVAKIGTGTTASDLTHTSPFTGGGVRVKIVTKSGTTLANVSGTFQCVSP